MISIEKLTLVGKGLHRECYRHPNDVTLCIKILTTTDLSEIKREQKYYRKLIQKGISWDMIPKFHGEINTSLGVGYIFDLISDHTGEVSRTLEYYLTNNKSETHSKVLKNALYELKDYLLQQRIITMTLKPKNICCKKNINGDVKLFIVDNLGNSDFIPICNYSSYLAKKKILRKWRSFENLILNTYKTEHLID